MSIAGKPPRSLRAAVASLGLAASLLPLAAGPAAAMDKHDPRMDKILVALVRFRNTTQVVYGRKEAEAVLGEAIRYFEEVSYGKVKLSGEVLDWRTIDLDATCDHAPILWTSIAALSKDVDFTKWGRLVLLFPDSGCPYGGLGTIGAWRLALKGETLDYSLVWMNGRPTLRVLAHELGHNLGLQHASSLECGKELSTATSSCMDLEYGDPYEAMGGRAPGHFSAYHKHHLGWISDAQLPRVPNKAGTYRYKLSPLETPCSKDMRVPISPEEATSAYNFVAGSKVGCEERIRNTFGINWPCTEGGGCSVDGKKPGFGTRSANPYMWGACLDARGVGRDGLSPLKEPSCTKGIRVPISPKAPAARRYNFVAPTKWICEQSIWTRLGLVWPCTMGGGCSVDGKKPGFGSPSANPTMWGACLDAEEAGQAKVPEHDRSDLVIEFRRPIGFDRALFDHPEDYDGALVHVPLKTKHGNSIFFHTHLLDLAEGQGHALKAGGSWDAPNGQIAIKAAKINNQGQLEVEVTVHPRASNQNLLAWLWAKIGSLLTGGEKDGHGGKSATDHPHDGYLEEGGKLIHVDSRAGGAAKDGRVESAGLGIEGAMGAGGTARALEAGRWAPLVPLARVPEALPPVQKPRGNAPPPCRADVALSAEARRDLRGFFHSGKQLRRLPADLREAFDQLAREFGVKTRVACLTDGEYLVHLRAAYWLERGDKIAAKEAFLGEGLAAASQEFLRWYKKGLHERRRTGPPPWFPADARETSR